MGDGVGDGIVRGILGGAGMALWQWREDAGGSVALALRADFHTWFEQGLWL
jgi:hypothetical protein